MTGVTLYGPRELTYSHKSNPVNPGPGPPVLVIPVLVIPVLAVPVLAVPVLAMSVLAMPLGSQALDI